MIIDTIENADKYYSVHPLFEQAFNYIHSTDLLNAEMENSSFRRIACIVYR